MFALVQWQDGEGHSERGGCDHVWDRDGKMERGENGTASGCDHVWITMAAIAMTRWRLK